MRSTARPASSLARRWGPALASNVLRESLHVRPGENVTVEAWSSCAEWARYVVSQARRLGAHPLWLYEDEPEFWETAADPARSTTGSLGRHELGALRHTDVYVFFYGPSEWPREIRLGTDTSARRATSNLEWLARAERAGIRGVRLWLGRASRLAAEFWNADLRAWQNELVQGSLVPPREMRRTGRSLARRLERGHRLTIRNPDGSQLELRLKGYRSLLLDGAFHAGDVRAGAFMVTLPSGVVEVCVDESYAEGTFVCDTPSHPNRLTIRGGRWTFHRGRLVDFTLDSGLEEFRRQLGRAGRDAARPALFSIGLNPRIRLAPQMTYLKRGAIVCQIGGNRYFGGSNASPFSSWLVASHADVDLDGHLLVRRGVPLG